MNLSQRIQTTCRLTRYGRVRVGNDVAVDIGGLVKIIRKNESKPMIHPYLKTPLENPMTWDTFTHIYLLDK